MTDSPTGRGSAFTIIEMMMVMAVIAVLITLSLPGLSRMRAVAHDVATLAQLRQHSAIFIMYTNDYDDYYPAITETTRTLNDRKKIGRYVWRTTYFRAYLNWHIALVDQYYAGRTWGTEFLLPGAEPRGPRQTVLRTDYWYSSSFLADPDFWNYEKRTGPDQFRAVRWFEVSYPSKKTLLLASGGPWWRVGDTTLNMAFSDGSARGVEPSELAGVYEFGDGNWPQSAFGYPGVPGMHTINGVRGRDVN